MEGWCCKCRMKKEMIEVSDVTPITTKRGIKHMRTGKCPDCGTKMSVMVAKV